MVCGAFASGVLKVALARFCTASGVFFSVAIGAGSHCFLDQILVLNYGEDYLMGWQMIKVAFLSFAGTRFRPAATPKLMFFWAPFSVP